MPGSCRRCGSASVYERIVQHVLETDGRVFSGGVRARVCAACQSSELDTASLRDFELVSACRLADSGARSGGSLKFIRTALQLGRAELADLLDVPLAQVTRWEADEEPVPRLVAALVGCFAHDRLSGRDATMYRLRACPVERPHSTSGIRRGADFVSEPPRPSDAPASDRGPILVVEDDDEIRAAVRALLEDEGYEVYWARHGQEALEVLAVMPKPRVMVLDLMMPIMSGWELMRAMRNDPILATIPIVVLSAVADFAPGPEPARFIRKPLDVDALLSAVRELAA